MCRLLWDGEHHIFKVQVRGRTYARMYVLVRKIRSQPTLSTLMSERVLIFLIHYQVQRELTTQHAGRGNKYISFKNQRTPSTWDCKMTPTQRPCAVVERAPAAAATPWRPSGTPGIFKGTTIGNRRMGKKRRCHRTRVKHCLGSSSPLRSTSSELLPHYQRCLSFRR